ncbi:unnamed protein product [Rotaria sp. Silwood2]|nr:unnamed protein product [Rotaria sp. Silwood2]CAF2885157.1 unnamed protein product [Rotaria sp. Silwood2]CAF3283150.1 unnamed protein product [Rotaria sp. Silwood2]CAF4092033.1 unnamed protein product [Rotaria sp. Silwood2]CAF4310817.1 unnamed protein product [Rotaria sp. Silwood2]
MVDVMYASQFQQRAPKLNPIKPDRKLELDKAALECIIIDGRPFGEFRRLGMSKFLNIICPGYRGPSRKTVRRQLGLSYHKYRQELRIALASVNAIAITVDIWTKKQTSFICLTGHVFNNKYESISIVLGFRRLSGAHRADNIKKYILYEMQNLEIEEKVCAIVSDNGSNIKKAINEIKPGQRFSCIAHNINLVVRNGLKIWEPVEKKKKKVAQATTTNTFIYSSDSDDDEMSEPDRADIPEELEDEGDEDCKRIEYNEGDENNTGGEDFDEDESSTGSDNPSDSGGGDYISEDEFVLGVESEDEHDDNYEGEDDKEEHLIEPYRTQLFVYRLIERVRACVTNIHNTRAIYDYVKKQAKTSEPKIKAGLVSDFIIRWNTTFIMIDRFNNHRFIIDNVNSQPYRIPDISTVQRMILSSKKFEFTNNDWFNLMDLHVVLKPFFISTNIISAKNYPTLGAGYSVQYALRYFLFGSAENDSSWLKSLKFCLRQTFELYFDEKIEKHQKDTSLVSY